MLMSAGQHAHSELSTIDNCQTWEKCFNTSKTKRIHLPIQQPGKQFFSFPWLITYKRQNMLLHGDIAEKVPNRSMWAYLHLWSRGSGGYGRYPSSPAVVSAGPCCFLWPGSAGLPAPWSPRSDSPPEPGDFPSLASASPALPGVASPFLTSSAPRDWGEEERGQKKFVFEAGEVVSHYPPSGHPNPLEWVLYLQI